MNKKEVITKVSNISKVNISDCGKVLDAHEDVISNKVADSSGIGSVFNMVYECLSIVSNYKSAKK